MEKEFIFKRILGSKSYHILGQKISDREKIYRNREM